MVRRIIIPIRELFQTQEEIRASVEAVERAKQLIRDYEQSVCDLLSGEHGRRIKEMMEEISKDTVIDAATGDAEVNASFNPIYMMATSGA
ncbi:MAG: hypothetical protein CEN92_275, partial [Candidatus Berkelbacteria bacterium Licking1014_96]